jgi:putative hemolysin
MRELRAQFVVLVDEYGGTAGILTLNDILEEIVGQISPAESEMPQYFEQEGTILVDGRTHVRILNRECNLLLPQNGVDTVGGYVMELLGRLPRAGDTVADENCRFRVIRMAGRRVGALRVELRSDVESAEPGDSS